MSVQYGGPPRTRTRMSRAARREQLLESAARAFVRGGYHGTHVDDVIREAGVARGTFYLHFDSKHAVFAALVDRMLAVFLAAGPHNRDPEITDLPGARRIVRSHYRALLDLLHRNADLCRILMEEAAGADKGFEDRLTAHRVAWQQLVCGRIARMRDAKLARPGIDAEVTAWGIVGAVEMIARLYVLRGHAPDLDRLADALVDLDLQGVVGPERAHLVTGAPASRGPFEMECDVARPPGRAAAATQSPDAPPGPSPRATGDPARRAATGSPGAGRATGATAAHTTAAHTTVPAGGPTAPPGGRGHGASGPSGAPGASRASSASSSPGGSSAPGGPSAPGTSGTRRGRPRR